MIFFNLPKPRRFHHEYIYFDERKERLKKIGREIKGKKGEGVRGRCER